jgi:hypothetical protein
LHGPLVDVDGVDVGRGGEHPEREGDRSPPAAEVQERSREGRVRDLGEQDRRAHIDAVRRKMPPALVIVTRRPARSTVRVRRSSGEAGVAVK